MPISLRQLRRVLNVYADTVEHLPTLRDDDPQLSRILTYHREGDSQVLYDLAKAYELLRMAMTQEERSRFEEVVLRRLPRRRRRDP